MSLSHRTTCRNGKTSTLAVTAQPPAGVLAFLNTATQAIAAVAKVGEAKKVADYAASLRVLAAKQKWSREQVHRIKEIEVRATRKMGDLLAVTPKAKGARAGGKKTSPRGSYMEPRDNGQTLADLGITKGQSHRAQQVAAIPEGRFESFVANSNGNLSVGGLLQHHKREEWREGRAVAARRSSATGAGIVVGDFRHVAKALADNSVDLIFTDPPYDRASVPLYGDLAQIAAAKLCTGGSLVTYYGHHLLPEVMDLIWPHLRYWGQFYVVLAGPRFGRMNEYGTIIDCKPLLWYVKESRGDKQTFVNTRIPSRPEKDAHEWQQAIMEAEYLIEKLTVKGGFVFDPFCGSGTTAVAAKKLGRRYLTCDVDAGAVAIATERMAHATA